jgi:hypothetical protein
VSGYHSGTPPAPEKPLETLRPDSDFRITVSTKPRSSQSVSDLRSASSSPGNPRATASVVVGALALAAVPLGVLLSQYSTRITLVQAGFVAAPLGIALGAYALVLARRGRETVVRTLGRSGGEAVARAGRVLGTAGLCLSITAGLALAFYGLLVLFAQ